MDEAKVAVTGVVIAAGKSRGVFEPVEPAFDNVAQGIDGGIDRQPVPIGRDDSDAATLLHIFAHEVSVIPLPASNTLGAGPSAFMIGR